MTGPGLKACSYSGLTTALSAARVLVDSTRGRRIRSQWGRASHRTPAISRRRRRPPPNGRAASSCFFTRFPSTRACGTGSSRWPSGGWRVIAPHFRGVDGGAGDPPATSLEDYAGDVIDLLDALHIKQAVIGGLSMGGYVGVRDAAARRPLFSGAHPRRHTARRPTRRKGSKGAGKCSSSSQAKGPAAVAEEMIPKLLGDTTRRTRPDVVDRVRSLVLSNSADAIAGAVRALMTRPDSTPLLSTIHVPTLIIVGDEDTVTPPATRRARCTPASPAPS